MQMLLYVTDPTNDNEHVVSVSPGQQTTAEKIIVIRFDVMVSFCFFFFRCLVWFGHKICMWLHVFQFQLYNCCLSPWCILPVDVCASHIIMCTTHTLEHHMIICMHTLSIESKTEKMKNKNKNRRKKSIKTHYIYSVFWLFWPNSL